MTPVSHCTLQNTTDTSTNGCNFFLLMYRKSNSLVLVYLTEFHKIIWLLNFFSSLFPFSSDKILGCNPTSSSSSAFPVISLRFTIFGEISAHVTIPGILSNHRSSHIPLHGWCMLGVLLPAFSRLGHACQDLLSPCDGMHVCTD